MSTNSIMPILPAYVPTQSSTMEEPAAVATIETPAPQATNAEKLDKEVVEALNKNTNTSKVAAYAALGTSVATLIPLSIIALKTGKMGKVVGEVAGNANKVLKNVNDVTSVAGGLVGTVANSAGEIMEKVDLSKMMTTIQEILASTVDKVGKIDVEKISSQISGLLESAQGKVGEFDVEQFNKQVANIQTLFDKIEGILDTTEGALDKVTFKKLREGVSNLGTNLKTALHKGVDAARPKKTV